jgi:two-component system sensor histidine kinase YesM
MSEKVKYVKYVKNNTKKLNDIFMKSNLKTKINLYYLVALFMSFLVSYGIYNTLNERAIEKQVGVSAAQTLQALDKNLDFMLDEVTTFSNLIFFDRDIQNALRNVKLDDPDPYLQNLFNEYIINMLLSGDYISSVYLYDNYSMRYAQGKRGVQPLTIPNIMDAPWYKRALELDGNLMWVLNSGGILKNPTNEGYLSLIRIIKDVRTYEKLAVLIVNVDEKTIVDQFSSISYGNKSHFFVLNENNDYITHPDIDKNIIEDQVKPNLIGNNGHIVKKLEKTKMIISYTTSKISNWRIVGLIPLSDLSKHLRSISYIAILILVVNSIFMTLGGNYITKLITKPLRRMQKYMKKAEQGNFEAIPVDQNRDDEVIQLQKVFNKMVMRIETLIEEVKEEQKII